MWAKMKKKWVFRANEGKCTLKWVFKPKLLQFDKMTGKYQLLTENSEKSTNLKLLKGNLSRNGWKITLIRRINLKYPKRVLFSRM